MLSIYPTRLCCVVLCPTRTKAKQARRCSFSNRSVLSHRLVFRPSVLGAKPNQTKPNEPSIPEFVSFVAFTTTEKKQSTEPNRSFRVSEERKQPRKWKVRCFSVPLPVTESNARAACDDSRGAPVALRCGTVLYRTSPMWCGEIYPSIHPSSFILQHRLRLFVLVCFCIACIRRIDPSPKPKPPLQP